MRLVWTTENADQFRAFCSFLHAKSILFTTEEQVVRDWASEQYGTRKYLLWITDEDQVDTCIEWLVKFIDNPTAAEFVANQLQEARSSAGSSSSVKAYLEERLKRPIAREEERKKEFSGHIRLTAFVILVCSLLFLYELYTEKKTTPTPPEVRQEFVGLSPIRKLLLFDFPEAYELVNKIVLSYGPNALTKPQELPDAGKYLYSEFLRHPAFPGYFPYMLAYSKQLAGREVPKNPPLEEVTLFEKIREGQVWRLFSPTLLHVDILHLFFNMIWVLLLGTQIEARIGSIRLLLLMLISGVISNIAQYLMSGPNFVGFSGIICAMATYIKARQLVAPWEAYQMSASTFAFIMFFIGVLALLSVVTFMLEVFQNVALPINIANTAHLVGALIGYGLGKMRFFSWQLHK